MPSTVNALTDVVLEGELRRVDGGTLIPNRVGPVNKTMYRRREQVEISIILYIYPLGARSSTQPHCLAFGFLHFLHPLMAFK